MSTQMRLWAIGVPPSTKFEKQESVDKTLICAQLAWHKTEQYVYTYDFKNWNGQRTETMSGPSF